ncbi:MAG: lysoplasmalogenase family protein [Spirochaetales bacterium]|nr:lysoplasmalogenase family protein [Spirochaetales bacterium]
MVISLLIIILGLVLQSLFIQSEIDGKMKAAVVLKGTASFMFVLLGGYLLSSKVTMFGDFIFKGLIFGMIGDILLNLRYLVPKQKALSVFGLGVLSFTIGHAFYFSAIVDLGGSGIFLWTLLLAIIISIAIMLLIKKHLPIDKKYVRVFCYIYIAIVVVMFSSALSLVITKGASSKNLSFLVGAFLFLVSDIFTVYYSFSDASNTQKALNLYTYYLAQILIALTLAL